MQYLSAAAERHNILSVATVAVIYYRLERGCNMLSVRCNMIQSAAERFNMLLYVRKQPSQTHEPIYIHQHKYSEFMMVFFRAYIVAYYGVQLQPIDTEI